MIEINLLPKEYRPQAVSKFAMPELPIKKTIITAAGIIFSLQLFASLFAGYEVFELKTVKNRLDRLREEGRGVAQEKADIAGISDRLSKIVSMIRRNYYWSSLLSGLSNGVTKGVWLTGFSVAEAKPSDVGPKSKGADAKSVTKVLQLDGSVVGSGEETACIGKFIKELKKSVVFSSLFSSIELSNIVQKKIRDFDVYDFSLFCTFKPQKAASQ